MLKLFHACSSIFKMIGNPYGFPFRQLAINKPHEIEPGRRLMTIQIKSAVSALQAYFLCAK